MIMYLLSQAVSAWFAFLIPCFSTWKAVAHRPLSDPELERWNMYWICLGAFLAAEAGVGWLVNWLPFYYELRMVFLLFLSLPQVEGSTFVYKTYLEPYFKRNEAGIDAWITAAQTNLITFVQEQAVAIWQKLYSIATKASSANPAATTGPNGQPVPPSTSQPSASNLLSMGADLFHSYGPWAMGAIKSSMGTTQPRPAASTQQSANSVPVRPSPSSGVQQRSPYSSSDNVMPPRPPSFPQPEHH